MIDAGTFLTLDRALLWESGLGVSLKYNFDGPDIGAFEYPDLSSGNDNIEKVSVFDVSGVYFVKVTCGNGRTLYEKSVKY